MDLDNLAESEVAIAVAATVAVLSPRVRNLLRRGAVYGLAGLLMAGDTLTGAARSMARGAQDGASTAAVTVQEASERIKAAAAAAGDPAADGTAEIPKPASRGRSRVATEGAANE